MIICGGYYKARTKIPIINAILYIYVPYTPPSNHYPPLGAHIKSQQFMLHSLSFSIARLLHVQAASSDHLASAILITLPILSSYFTFLSSKPPLSLAAIPGSLLASESNSLLKLRFFAVGLHAPVVVVLVEVVKIVFVVLKLVRRLALLPQGRG